MGKQLCSGSFETAENGDRDLVVRIPWDDDSLTQTLRNCNREKNSVTLVNGDIVGDIGNRGNALSLWCDIDGHRVELKGGVNLYVTRPATAGKAAAYTKADAKALDQAQMDDSYKWVVLASPLLAKDGSIVRKQGERIMRESLSDLFLSGCKLMEDSAGMPQPIDVSSVVGE